jgi:hypothetical protein
MKAYNIYWKDKSLKVTDEDNRGGTIVVADSITKAIARFQDTYHPGNRVIDSVYHEGDEVLIDGVQD